MKEFLTIKNILIIIFAIYVIILVERLMDNSSVNSESLINYQKDKIKMQDEIINLNTKINFYEKAIIKNSIDIVNMSINERDSTRNVLNPR